MTSIPEDTSPSVSTLVTLDQVDVDAAHAQTIAQDSYMLFEHDGFMKNAPFSLELQVDRSEARSAPTDMTFIIRKCQDPRVPITEILFEAVLLPRKVELLDRNASEGPYHGYRQGYKMDLESTNYRLENQPNDGRIPLCRAKVDQSSFLCWTWTNTMSFDFMSPGSEACIPKQHPGLLDFRWHADPFNPVNQCPETLYISTKLAAVTDLPQECDVVFR